MTLRIMAIQKLTTSTGKTKTVFRTFSQKPILVQSCGRKPKRFSYERRDCTVWALTKATKKGYSVIHEFCKKHGRMDKRGANMPDFLYNLKDLGFKFKRVYLSEFSDKRNLTVSNFLTYHYKG